MAEKKQISLKLNFFMNVLLTLSSFIFPLITFPYISRILLPIGTGKVALANSVISYFAMFSMLGIPTYGIRAVAKVRDNRQELSRVTQELFIINFIMTVAVYAVFFLALPFVPRIAAEKPLYLITSLTLVLNLIGIEWLYKGLEQYTFITVRSIIFKFIALIAMFALVHSKEDYVIYGAICVFSASASYIINFVHARKFITFKPTGNYNFRPHIKPILVFFAMSVATTIYTNLDTVMLGFMTTDIDVGYYNAAVKIKTVLVGVVTSLGAVILPRASYYIEKKLMDEFKRICKMALNFVMIIALPLTLYFTYYAEPGVLFLSGPAYEPSVLPMQVIMPTVFFIGLTNILGIQMLVPMGKERQVLYSEIVGAVVDLVLNFILIPKLHSTGAAIGTLVAELAVLIYQYVVLRDLVRPMLRKISYWKIAVGLVLGSAASFWCAFLNIGNFLTLLVSAVIFFAVYFGFLILCKEPMAVEMLDVVLRKLKIKKA